MRLEYEFLVPVPVGRAWSVLLDVERVAPCVPGATLTSYDGDSFAGTVRVRVGPVSLTYQGKGRFVERDEDARRVVMEATGRDSRGGGTAAGKVTATLGPSDTEASTVVTMVADLSVTGRPAQFGRGMIAEVGGKLVNQFADCLAQRLAETPPPVTTAATVAAAASAATVPAPGATVPPVDILRLGAGPVLRRVAPYAIGFAVGALVTWALMTLLS